MYTVVTELPLDLKADDVSLEIYWFIDWSFLYVQLYSGRKQVQ
jgi:hypothetical protein